MRKNQDKLLQLPVTCVDVCEEGEEPSFAAFPCEIDRDITFKTAGLEAYCLSNWKPVVFDAFVVAAAVDFCDRLAHRPQLGWGRQFEVGIPVHEPDRWSGQLCNLLVDSLGFLTGDRWRLHFRPRKSPANVPGQSNFDIPDPSSAILPFSDGLDSLMVSALVERQRKLIRVRLGPERNSRKAWTARQPFAEVPYRIKQDRYRFTETTSRGRGFKFTMLSGIAAYLSEASDIIIAESGQEALGPSLVPVGHVYVDYRNHPRFMAKMGPFLSALFDRQIGFIFPRVWYTKGETLKEFVDLTNGEWADTRSCWQQSRQVSVGGHRRQCGVCAACMLRRMSVHAAGQDEPSDTYVWENLSASDVEEGAAPGFESFTEALREYAIAGVLHLEHLAELSDSPLHAESKRKAAMQIAPDLGVSSEEAEKKLERMLGQHKLEWRNFVDSLGADSFVTKWTSGRS